MIFHGILGSGIPSVFQWTKIGFWSGGILANWRGIVKKFPYGPEEKTTSALSGMSEPI
jgi:hypothetical protein